jgi:hypothetical protein
VSLILLSNICFRRILPVPGLCFIHAYSIVKAIVVKALADLCLLIILLSRLRGSVPDDFASLDIGVSSCLAIELDYNGVS